MKAEKIFLVGLPGTGKSYFGEIMSRKMNIPFIDLDAFIEAKKNCSIGALFSHEGEHHFRLIESQALNEIIKNQTQFILATGGGTPCFHNGMKTMRESGIVVHLEIEDQELIKRLNRSEDRPLVQSDVTKTVANFREKRDQIYQQANITLEDRDLDGLLEKIANL